MIYLKLITLYYFQEFQPTEQSVKTAFCELGSDLWNKSLLTVINDLSNTKFPTLLIMKEFMNYLMVKLIVNCNSLNRIVFINVNILYLYLLFRKPIQMVTSAYLKNCFLNLYFLILLQMLCLIIIS